MYVWVILAVFIVALHSFNLAVRSDMRSIYVEPQAESALTKLVLQHRAAKQYLTYEIADKTKPYPSGEIELEKLDPFMPSGFELEYEVRDEEGEIDEDAEVPVTQRNITRVYCLDSTSLDDGLSRKIDDCRSENATNFLITYGCVPQRWMRIDANRPANDFLNAIKKVYASGSNFGYTVDVEPEDFSGMTAEEKKEYLSYNPINSTMRIDNTEQTWLSIPQYIISNDVGETGFSKVCGDERQCEYCLVYMDSIGKD